MVVVGDLAPVVEQVLRPVADPLAQGLGFGRLQSGVAARPVGERLDHEVEGVPLVEDLGRPLGRRHRGVAQARQGDQRAGQPAVEGPGRERRDARRLDGAVERLVEDLEPLEVRAVARPVDVEQRHDQAGPVGVAADAARRLDVLGAGLGLAEHDHQAQPGDVEADRDHVGGDRHVHPVLLVEPQGQPALRLGDLVGGHAGGQLDDLVGDRPVGEEPLLLADPLAVGVAGEPGVDLVLDDPPAAAQLAQAVEVAEQRHVGVGGVVGVLLAAVGVVGLLGGPEQGQIGPQHHDLEAAPLGGEPQIEPGVALAGRMGLGEERVAAVGTRRREDIDLPAVEQGLDLVLGAADGGRRGDDLGPDLLAVDRPGCTARRGPTRRARPWCPSGRRSGAARPG